MTKPTQELVKRVLDAISSAADFEYFFDNLTTSDWITPLTAEGFFRVAPEPIRVEGGIQFPDWPASRYLARVADQDPEGVLDVFRVLPETDNVRVRHDFLDALANVPPNLATEFIPRVERWLTGPYQWLLPIKTATLIRRLARAGFPEQALSLAKVLFATESATLEQLDDDSDYVRPARVGTLDSYEYERLLTECWPELVSVTGIVGLQFLCELLVRVIMKDSLVDSDRHDFSFIWRPSISAHEQNSVPSVRNAIVSNVYDASLQLASRGDQALKEVVSTLESYEWTAMRRIALEVLRQRADDGSDAVSTRLTDRDRLFDRGLHHEYWHLLHDRYTNLGIPQQKSILAAMRVGPPSFADPDVGNPEERRVGLEAWQARFLAAVSDHLRGEDRDWYENLVTRGRVGGHPDFLSYATSWVGPTSPISESEFERMNDDELIDYLRSWEPEEAWGAPSPEGLGRALSAAVRSAPIRFAEFADKFTGLDPTYLNSMLSGFRDAAKNSVPLPWEPILELSRWVVEQGKADSARNGESSAANVWVWTRSTIAHLLAIGFGEGPAGIPFEFRFLAWAVLEPLTGDPQPTIEEEEKYGNSNSDASTYAINTVRGQAIDSAVKYGLWVYRNESAMHESYSFDQIPELRSILESHVRPEDDPSYAVHSMFGQWFPWLLLLDPSWITEKVSVVFPPEDDHFLYWECAWDSYINYCPPYDSTFEVLMDEYLRAVHRVDLASMDRKHPLMVRSRLGQHLMIFYLRGRIEIDNQLLISFFEEVPEELRSSALRFAGRTFYAIDDQRVHPYPNISDDAIDRAKRLWASRLNTAKASHRPDWYRDEIAEFGWWFLSPTFEPEWSLEMLIEALRFSGRVEFEHMVASRLAELASDFPEKSLEALKLLIQSDRTGFLSLGHDSIESVLRTTLASEQIHLRQAAVDITHELGAKGYRQFRSLLRHRPEKS